jgi:hypothetical protein
MRVHPSIYRDKSLVVHKLLSGVRLLDVWQIDLANGGEGRTLADLLALVETRDDIRRLNPAVRFLFWLRDWMGRLFRWDDDPTNRLVPPESYVQLVDEVLASKSITPPGTLAGPITSRPITRVPSISGMAYMWRKIGYPNLNRVM